MHKSTLTILGHLLLFSYLVNADVPRSFSAAKRLSAQIYSANPNSFYCGCKIDWIEGKGVPNLESCGYEFRTQESRSERIEWEHIMPAWQFGHQRMCWKSGGRKNCSKDKQYRMMEADLHNLVPAVGEVNGDRSNYRFSEWNGKPYQYGECSIIVSFKDRKVQPPEHTRGPIARIYLYMSERYQLFLSDQQRKLMSVWDNKYLPSSWECERNRLIFEIQGWPNDYVSKKCI